MKPVFHFNKFLSLIHNLKEASYEYEAIVPTIITTAAGGATSANTILAVDEKFQKQIHAFNNPKRKSYSSLLISRS